jgi:hypothetical protein
MDHCGKLVGFVHFSLCGLQSFSLTSPGSWKAYERKLLQRHSSGASTTGAD